MEGDEKKEDLFTRTLEKLEKILQEIKEIVLEQEKVLQSHESRIVFLEGPRKFYKIDKYGNFIS